MTDLFFETYSDDVIRENLKLREGEEITYRYPDVIGKTPVLIFFTNQDRACWFAKYKKQYYGSIISNIERADEYSYIDVYRSLRENAILSLKAI